MKTGYNSRHGMSDTRIYNIWEGMKKRCNNPHSIRYRNYGGRGITYDDRWERFENFYEDMKEGYEDHLTLDRKEIDGNYTKDNCRWATEKEQSYNKKDTVFVIYKGERYSLIELFNTLNPDVTYKCIKSRIKRGLSVESAFNQVRYSKDIHHRERSDID